MIRRLLLLLALLLPQLAAAQTFPPLSGRVVDAANLLDAGHKAQIDALSVEVEKVAGRQLVVATIPDLQGYTIEDYGNALARNWKIGQKGANNGIVLIVAPNERKVRIEVGFGLEPIMTDALASTIIDDKILPAFKSGDMPGGILAGAQAIAEQMKLPPESAEAQAAKTVADAHASQGSSGYGGLVLIFLVIVVIFIVLPIVSGRARGKRYRRGRAPVVIWGPGLGSGWSGGGGWGGGGSSWSSGDWGGSSSGSSDFGSSFSGGGGDFGGGGASGSW